MREKIIQTALKYFAKEGYETSLENISKELEITKAAIYYHFKNKEELYNEVFKHYFKNLTFTDHHDLEKNIIEYIHKLSALFSNQYLAMLFAKELSNEGRHLKEDTLKILSKTIEFLAKTLEGSNINPFFLQTLIISTLTTYNNTLSLRKRVAKIRKINTHFHLEDELIKTVLSYIKADI
ncbi:MAG: TetR/AcrR family transcriptional regulator [Epsilonproteobacteria bacterium]|nr:TetR/AcrR family transcriptional regulator [Campylobacterota bacterium]